MVEVKPMKVYMFQTLIHDEWGEPCYSCYSAFAENETEAMLKIQCRYAIPASVEFKLLQVDEDRRKNRDRRVA